MSRIRRLLALGASLALVSAQARAQQSTTISGTVTGENAAPVSGASVFLEGMGLGTQTDPDGRYTFTVPAARATGQQATLTARRIGLKPESRQVTLRPGATLTENFTLAANPLQLGEVVVTGAGTTTSSERIGTVRTAVDSQAIVQANTPNVVAALAGKAPGVEIREQSGSPGASTYIRIRGLNTIQGTGQPLFIVDGTPIDNSTISTTGSIGSTDTPNRASDINPEDIASIEILKSAAAAAIYGARAGQGVVLITTKSGHAGPPRYTLRSNTRVDQVTGTEPLQREFGQGSAGAFSPCASLDCNLTSGAWGPRLAAGTPTFDHSKEIYNDGYLFDNALSVSGGSDRTTFFLSGASTNQNGIVEGNNDRYDRSTARLKASQDLGGGFRLDGNIAYVDQRGAYIQKGSNTSGVNLGEWRSPPDFDNRVFLSPTTGLHRSYRFPNPSAASTTTSRGYDNPYFVINDQDNTQQVGRAFGNLGATYTPNERFNFQYTLGADYVSDERLETLPLTSSAYPQGQVVRGNIVNYQIDHNLTGTYTQPWKLGWDTRVTLGANLNSRNFRQNFVLGQNLIAPTPFNLQNVTNLTPLAPGDYRSLVRGESYFAQVQQSIADQLFLTGTVRNDGFSTFGVSQKRHTFPAITAAWTFTNVFNPGSFLTTGRLRAAYGENGTEPNVYATNGSYFGQFTGGSYGDQLLISQGGLGGLVTSGRKPQDNLGPEVQRELEAGIDIGFLRDRADASVTYYNRRNNDVIFDLPLPGVTGFSVQAANGGAITNKGIEATLNLRPIETQRFGWDLGFQVSANRSHVVSLTGVDAVDLPTGGFFTGTLVSAVPGYPMPMFRTADFVRCRYNDKNNSADITGDGTIVDINALCRAANAPQNAVYLGPDGYPVDDPTLRPIGDPNPKWLGSARTSLRFGKITVGGLVDVRRGGINWNGTKGALYNFGTHADTRVRDQELKFGQTYCPGGCDPKSFKVFGPGVGVPALIDQSWYQGLGSGFGDVSTQFMEDASYVKLREISLAYTFDQPWVRRKAGLSSIDIRLAGRNLHTWTKYSGIDPETNLGGAEVAAQGVDYFSNPLTRSWVITVGLNR
jgi:TonB-linked SusC/RagA family outer membrane protein